MLRSVALALVALVLITPLAAQDARPIREGQTLSGTLASDSEHEFTLQVDAEYFVFGEVDQIDVDVVVTVLGPDGERVAQFDGPSRGVESFQFTTEEEGTYVIRVAPFEEQEGDYTLTLERAEPVATDPAERVDQLMARFSGMDTPGGVVGVVDGGRVVFEKAFGMASLEYGVPHGVETPTNIGSVTKQFTAMGILLLQKDGKLSLSDDIRKHIPELPDFGTTITLKNMLNHATGYRELYNFLPMSGRQGEDAIRREEAIRIIQRQPELQAAPNTEFNYNNTGFILLATVIERVSEKTFPEFMKERVFEPLGMNDTRVKYSQGEVIPGASQGYAPASGGGWRSTRDLAASAGAGGIYTTFPDMTRWMANYRDGTVGGRAAIDAMTARNILQNGDTSTYALGLDIGPVNGRDLYQITGGCTPDRTYFAYFPEIDGGVFISSNNATFSTGIGSQVARLFFEDRMEDADEDDGEEDSEAEGEDSGDAMPTERMEAIVGDWIIEVANLPAEFTLEDGTLYAEPQGQRKIELRTTSDSTIAAVGIAVTIVFHFEDDGSVDRATFTQGQAVPMRRLEEAALSAEDMEAFQGRYYSRELEVWLEVRLQEDDEDDEAEARLVIERLRAAPVILNHREGTVFGGGFPFAEIDFQQASNGSITGLLAGNGRTTEVLFEKR